jgi:hypothetical protein
MKRPTMLYQAMLSQLSIDLEVPTERDFAYLQSRYEHEGLSFLTLSLPALSDSLESGIESGLFTLPMGFKPHRRSGTLPAFLQGLFKRVFWLDGSLRHDACPDSIYWIRQVSRFFKKPKIACTAQREAAAIRKYRAVEEDLIDYTPKVTRPDEMLDRVARILWSTVFPTVDTKSIVCGHGPGVTADRRLPNGRRRIKQWYQRFEDSFPVADHAFPNFGMAWDAGSSEGVQGIEFIDIIDEPPVKVVFVPKTLAAPRVIAVEPSPMQFVQQGLSRWIVDRLETHQLTKHSVRFSDQSVNRRLAFEASIDRRSATIDLSDASDRVHLDLVNRLFKSSPLLLFLQDARSLHANLPDGTNVVLRKFASMGSALCFPIEACVFYTLILSAILSAEGKRPSYANISNVSKRVSVFGDDLVIPTEHVGVVTDYLESYALRVNHRKSFSKSLFRESCGSDWYNGQSVLPIYARQLVPEKSSDWTPEHVMAWVSTANQFYLTGKWHLCQHIRGMLESVLRTSIPRSPVETEGIGFLSLLFHTKLRWNADLQGWQQSRLIYKPLLQKDCIDGDSVACHNRYFDGVDFRTKLRDSVDAPMERDTIMETPQRWGEFLSAGLLQRGHRNRLVDPSSSLVQLDERGGESGDNAVLRYVPPVFQAAISDLPRIKPQRLDFRSSTKRGAFALKRRWVMIYS